MKKIVLLIFAIAIFSNVEAQKFGVKAGLDLSTVVTDPVAEYGYQPGLNASVFFQKKFFPMLSLRPGLGLYQKGSTYEILNVLTETTINYVQFDADIKFKPPFVPIYMFAGPYISYALAGTNKVSGISVDITFGPDDTNNLDFGLNGGIGFQQNLPVGKLFLEVAYNYGMFDYDASSYTETFNRNISIDLGFMIGL
ncbi:MAG: porin family protein [Bacteroidota bacterium]|nr:porin family protein [Bacteroidota bacterium]